MDLVGVWMRIENKTTIIITVISYIERGHNTHNYTTFRRMHIYNITTTDNCDGGHYLTYEIK
jgi:hypothetical protein